MAGVRVPARSGAGDEDATAPGSTAAKWDGNGHALEHDTRRRTRRVASCPAVERGAGGAGAFSALRGTFNVGFNVHFP